MDLDTEKLKCDSCKLWLEKSFFHKNKSKNSGFQNKCIDCMIDYKMKIKKGLILEQETVKRDFYFIPDIFLVGYGRTQIFQHCCLMCESPFFCIKNIKEQVDLFCDDCEYADFKLPERNLSNVNFIGNIVGWMMKSEDPKQIRFRANYKKVFLRDNFTCRYCEYNMKNASVFIPLHIDHIKPWSAQGGNSLNNLVVSCGDCNHIATNKWFKDFEEKKEFILFEKQKKKWINRYEN